MKMWMWILGLAVTGCGEGVGDGGPCADLCRVLVGECGYAAFPDMASCIDGCTYEASEGQDVRGQADCVSEVGCDTFAILECENAHGG